ncbi:hypothetical protein, partial [Kineococcus glutinatus]|uniref:hypothetical protein n=1 Tax=Kineococcus glutinatus TaxID=1070872 RepID=UPI0031EF4827
APDDRLGGARLLRGAPGVVGLVAADAARRTAGAEGLLRATTAALDWGGGRRALPGLPDPEAG